MEDLQDMFIVHNIEEIQVGPSGHIKLVFKRPKILITTNQNWKKKKEKLIRI